MPTYLPASAREIAGALWAIQWWSSDPSVYGALPGHVDRLAEFCLVGLWSNAGFPGRPRGQQRLAVIPPSISIFPVFGLGAAAAISFRRTGLLIAPIAWHMTYNVTVVAAAYALR